MSTALTITIFHQENESLPPLSLFSPRSDFLHIIIERGFLHQCTNLEALDSACCKGSITAYIGFDATADSLHAGHLLSIMLLRWLQHTEHQPIVLLGGGTTRIGDPSGRDKRRKLLSSSEIDSNIQGMSACFTPFLRFGNESKDAQWVNNADWLDELSCINFLSEIGRYVSVSRMLSMDSVRMRLEGGHAFSFLEFSYALLQAYDFLQLARRERCLLQCGGSDQWSNILLGVDLARRLDQRTLIGLTTPLLTTASGTKMGKTDEGALWLHPRRLDAYAYWQFWRNTHDRDVGRFLRLFTELPLDEIVRLDNLQGQEINEAKKILAYEATILAHGKAAATAAMETAKRIFEEGLADDGLPSLEITARHMAHGVPLFDLLRRSGLTSSGAEARRLIRGGGVRLGNRLVKEETTLLTHADAREGVIDITVGKKRHLRVRILDSQ